MQWAGELSISFVADSGQKVKARHQPNKSQKRLMIINQNTTKPPKALKRIEIIRKDLACAKSFRTPAEALVVLMSTELRYKFW
ncbi:hypothetical protein [Sporomusa malonica]|uniref:hypothetical protein n=1 Tax=Sporomusa malonica TaxID=112901 RepID=UPI000A05465B|nr:hypothetical protein [Sporomusa malonica]